MSSSTQDIDFFLSKDLNQCIVDFKNFLEVEKGSSKKTIKSYFLDMKDFFEFICLKKNGKVNVRRFNSKSEDAKNLLKKVSIRDISSIEVNDIREWLSIRFSYNVSSRSNARGISALKTFFRFCNENEYFLNDSIFLIARQKFSKSLPKPVDEEVFIEFLKGINKSSKNTWHAERDKSITSLMFLSGLRISEIVSIKYADIYHNNGSIKILGKGSKQRIVPFPEVVSNYVNSYISHCPYSLKMEDKLFLNNLGKPCESRYIQRMFERVRILSNLPDYITPHKMRHGCATILLENSSGGDALKRIQDLLGHSRLSTTQIYTKISTKKLVSALNDAKYWD